MTYLESSHFYLFVYYYLLTDSIPTRLIPLIQARTRVAQAEQERGIEHNPLRSKFKFCTTNARSWWVAISQFTTAIFFSFFRTFSNEALKYKSNWGLACTLYE